MKKLLLVTSIVGWLVMGAAPARAATPTVRIWPVGDSITEGCCLSVGGAYRTRLYALLSNAGYNVDFVGELYDLVPPPDLPDIDHEGHDGYRIDEIDAGLQSWASVIDDPDVVLLHIGTNDESSNYNVSTAPNRLETLISHIATRFPYAKIIVASLIVAADPTIETRIQNFNSVVPGIVSHQASLGRQVYFTDMHSSCTVSDLSDQVSGLHPNATGYAKMATNWFGAVTSIIAPSGTANPPAILRVNGQVDLRHVLLTFSKPVADTSTTLANFSLSGGVSILQASLDSSLRTITLTTSPQAPGSTYTLTVNNVQDRTAQHNTIAPNTTATFQSGSVAEAVNYSLVYSLPLPNQVNFNSTPVPYAVDNHTSIGSFSRIAYYLQLQPAGGSQQYVWVSMDPFTTNPSKIGVPNIQSGAFFQQTVNNLNVQCNVPGVTTGNGLSGNLEFWWGDYGKSNAAGVPGASSTLFDFGDSASPSDPAGYGSMQVHNWAAGQTLFAYNDWGYETDISDLGIGNSSGTYPDWTFAANATNYTSKLLQVYVLPVVAQTAVLTVNSSNPNNGVAVTVSPADNNGAGSGTTPFTRTYSGGAMVALTASSVAGANGFQKWQRDGVDYSTSASISVLADANHTFTAVYGAPAATYTLSVASSNPSSGVGITVSPADKNGAGGGATPFSRTYNSGTVVSLTVAAQAGGNTFQKWQKDGVDLTTSANATVTMDNNHTLSAIYVSPVMGRTLSVASSNPSSGVSIGVSPADSNGAGSGVTPFNRGYNAAFSWEAERGAISAPLHVGSSGSVVYVVQDVGTGPNDGGVVSFTFNVAVAGTYQVSALVNTPDQDHNSFYVGFEFNQPLQDPLTAWDLPVTGGSWRKAYASWRGNGSNVAPQYPLMSWQLTAGQHTLYLIGREPGGWIDQVSVELVTPVNLTAPATVNGNTFQKWQKDGVDYSSSASTSVVMGDNNHTMTAIYAVSTPGTVVTVAATDPTAGEPGTSQGTGTFTFTRTGSTAASLNATFSVGGTATSGSDYTALGNTVTFAAGSAVATKTVSVIDDTLVEGNETVVLTLGSGAGYTVGSPASATVTIKDDDPIILDDASANGVTFVGTWTTSKSTSGYWGQGYKHDGNTGKGSKSATFSPTLATGNYSVYLWYTANPNRASNVPVDIVYNGGSTTVTVNQQVNGGQWNLLGTFSFAAGSTGYVRIRNTGTSGYVIADAVRWVPAP